MTAAPPPFGGNGDVALLAQRARALATGRGRVVLGISGPPGAGKSTLAAALAAALGPLAVLVPMDGFHLSQRELERLGRAARKGAPDTFDAAGYVALLERVRAGGGDAVYAPEFRRDLEEPVAGAICVDGATEIVITEGNYLLLDDGAFGRVRALLDEAWYLQLADELRRERLLARHRAYGRSPEVAKRFALGSDEDNARLIARTRERADLVIEADAGAPAH